MIKQQVHNIIVLQISTLAILYPKIRGRCIAVGEIVLEGDSETGVTVDKDVDIILDDGGGGDGCGGGGGGGGGMLLAGTFFIFSCCSTFLSILQHKEYR